MDHINYSVDMVTTIKLIRVLPNHKPWMTCEVQAFIKPGMQPAGLGMQLHTEEPGLQKGTKSAKFKHKQQTETHFDKLHPPQCVWEGIRDTTEGDNIIPCKQLCHTN